MAVGRDIGISFSPIPGKETLEDLPRLLQRLVGATPRGMGRLPRPFLKGGLPVDAEAMYSSLLGAPDRRPPISGVLAPEQPITVEAPTPAAPAPGEIPAGGGPGFDSGTYGDQEAAAGADVEGTEGIDLGDFSTDLGSVSVGGPEQGDFERGMGYTGDQFSPGEPEPTDTSDADSTVDSIMSEEAPTDGEQPINIGDLLSLLGIV